MKLQTVFISGGTKGIGLEAIRRFHAMGCKIVTCARNAAMWDSVLSEHPQLGDVDFRQADLCVDKEVAGLFDYIAANYGSLKFAINNASPKISATGDFSFNKAENLLSTLLSDLWAPALCLKHELPLMETGGAIVNISSVNGIRPTPGNAIYSAAKHGLEGLTRSVALEAVTKGIRINSVAPGPTWTPRWDERKSSGNPTIQEDVEKLIPLRRFASPADIVNAIEWLCSDKASYVVGHTLIIDGGLSLQ